MEAFQRVLFALYQTERYLCVRRTVHEEDVRLERLNRDQRGMLFGTRLARSRKTSETKLAANNTQDIVRTGTDGSAELWVDNYKLHIAANE